MKDTSPMTNSFDWDGLRVFHKVAQLGSMSAAATRLGTSLPTVSRRITQLESRLRAELFTRSTAGVRLTPAGDILLRHAERMSETVTAIHQDIAHTDDALAGAVSLALDDALGPYLIAPRLAGFQHTYPDINVQLSVCDHSPQLSDDGPDITIQFARPNQPDTIARQVGTLHYAGFASVDYLETKPVPTSLRSLNQHRAIVHQNYVDTIESGITPAKSLSHALDGAQAVNSTTAMIELCKRAGGIALLPSFLADTQPSLIATHLPGLTPLPLWLSYTERARNIPRCQAVIAWLRDCFDPGKAPIFAQSYTLPPRSEAA